MPNDSHERKSRSKNRDSHSDNHDENSSRHNSRSRHTRKRRRFSNNVFTKQMQQILNRLTSLEERRRTPSPPRPCGPNAGASPMTPPRPREPATTTAERGRSRAERRESVPSSSPGPSTSVVADRYAGAADRIIEAIWSINTTVRSNQSYYISSFDPSINDIDTWCEEVDRAKVLNYWNDNECLSRIGHCLKGDARTWLNEWVSNDRSWSNFKKEF